VASFCSALLQNLFDTGISGWTVPLYSLLTCRYAYHAYSVYSMAAGVELGVLARTIIAPLAAAWRWAPGMVLPPGNGRCPYLLALVVPAHRAAFFSIEPGASAFSARFRDQRFVQFWRLKDAVLCSPAYHAWRCWGKVA
jgi:hypothetical protein